MQSLRKLLMVTWLLLPVASVAAAPVDYARDVRPILAEHCYTCHGPDEAKRKAGLRLDCKEGAFQKLKSGDFALVSKNLGKSQLYQRITAANAKERMPPGKAGRPLSPAEADVLRNWIEQGADWPEHWAFVAPRRPPLPEVKNAAWARNPIDRFILARLEREGIAPSPEADKVTLIRRVSLDLTGLPPSLEEVDAFLLDNRADAYERLVERLLASPHYGERWARHWLDLTRYADSDGFGHRDRARSIWKYRDWVMDALNQDMPFDRFTIEQVAGDLLPNATREQRMATGFHRNTPIHRAMSVDPEEVRVDAVVDRVNTIGTIFFGLTIGCARCHDHKFDPISQREFYQLFAFLNGADEPYLELPTPQQAQRLEQLRTQIARAEKELGLPDIAMPAGERAWEKALTQGDRLSLPAEIGKIILFPPRGADSRTESRLVGVLSPCQPGAARPGWAGKPTALSGGGPPRGWACPLRHRGKSC